MPWRLPQYNYKKISTIFDLKTGKYIIGGHSQGGKMAAQFVYENPNLMRGLFLIGTSHPRDMDFLRTIKNVQYGVIIILKMSYILNMTTIKKLLLRIYSITIKI
jgi:pimeloyl-ACP methyl ester carboxylesterase